MSFRILLTGLIYIGSPKALASYRREILNEWDNNHSQPKPWEILFITCSNATFLLTLLFSNILGAKPPNVILKVIRL